MRFSLIAAATLGLAAARSIEVRQNKDSIVHLNLGNDGVDLANRPSQFGSPHIPNTADVNIGNANLDLSKLPILGPILKQVFEAVPLGAQVQALNTSADGLVVIRLRLLKTQVENLPVGQDIKISDVPILGQLISEIVDVLPVDIKISALDPNADGTVTADIILFPYPKKNQGGNGGNGGNNGGNGGNGGNNGGNGGNGGNTCACPPATSSAPASSSAAPSTSAAPSSSAPASSSAAPSSSAPASSSAAPSSSAPASSSAAPSSSAPASSSAAPSTSAAPSSSAPASSSAAASSTAAPGYGVSPIGYGYGY